MAKVISKKEILIKELKE
jgi:hypothetical protein